MKTLKIALISVLLLTSCQKKEGLTIETAHYDNGNCPACPKITINVPHILDKEKVASTINNSIKEEVIYLLSFSDEVEATSIEEAIKSFAGGFEELKRMYPEETTGWEAQIEAKVSYENKEVVTVDMDSYIFTGGAHGYSAKTFLNFDRQKGTEIENWQLLKDTLEFKKYAEEKFRAKEQIPPGESINSTGLMFENDSFHLPQNIGLTEKGLQLVYNQYEIASYADGPIELVLPYSEIVKYMTIK